MKMKKVKFNVWFRVGQVFEAEEFYNLLHVSDFITLEEIIKNECIWLHRTEHEAICIIIKQLEDGSIKIIEIEKQYI